MVVAGTCSRERLLPSGVPPYLESPNLDAQRKAKRKASIQMQSTPPSHERLVAGIALSNEDDLPLLSCCPQSHDGRRQQKGHERGT